MPAPIGLACGCPAVDDINAPYRGSLAAAEGMPMKLAVGCWCCCCAAWACAANMDMAVFIMGELGLLAGWPTDEPFDIWC
jgi:hypothetical protein